MHDAGFIGELGKNREDRAEILSRPALFWRRNFCSNHLTLAGIILSKRFLQDQSEDKKHFWGSSPFLKFFIDSEGYNKYLRYPLLDTIVISHPQVNSAIDTSEPFFIHDSGLIPLS